jgi:type III pantothenate kinase
MLLCDVGNTSFHFYDGNSHYKHSVASFNPQTIKEKTYYISVNESVNKQLEHLSNWHNLESFIERSKYYETMGIDRIFACEAIKNGVIVDAGSAITVDIVKYQLFQGGFIYPGKQAFQETLAQISPALQTKLSTDIDFKTLPKNTHDALSYGFLAPLRKEILSYDLQIFLTGGDAQFLAPLFKNAIVDELLLFKGMKKVLRKVHV